MRSLLRSTRAILSGTLAATVALASPLAAQATAAWTPEPARGWGFELSIRNIMRGPEHYGSLPSALRWTDDGRWIYFRWLPGGGAWHAEPALYRVSARGGTPEKLDDAAARDAEWIIADGYTREISSRAKVGDVQGESRVALLTTATGAVTWLDLAPEGYPAKEKPALLSAGFIPGTSTAWYVSEESGWAHVYTAGADGTGKRALTNGQWEVLNVQVPEDRTRFLREPPR